MLIGFLALFLAFLGLLGFLGFLGLTRLSRLQIMRIRKLSYLVCGLSAVFQCYNIRLAQVSSVLRRFSMVSRVIRFFRAVN